jgi:Tfp pilus assembly protein PilF
MPRLVVIFAIVTSVPPVMFAQSRNASTSSETQVTRRADALVTDGTVRLQRGDTEKAKRLFRRALMLDATNVAAHTYLGIIADHAGELTEAEHQFAEAARVAPASPEARNNHGGILLKLGRNAAAIKEFEASLRLDSKQTGALVNLAQIRFAEGTPEGMRVARSLFQDAEAIAPDVEVTRSLTVISLRLHEPTSAAQEFSRYQQRLTTAPPAVRTASARAELGAALLEAGLSAEAVTELEAAVAAQPSDSRQIVLLARAYREQKNLSAAERTLEAAIAQGVQSGPLYVALAEVYEESGHAEKAIPAMRHAVQLEPRNEKYRFRYAMLLTDTQAPQAAVVRLQEGLKEFPNSPLLWFAMGIAHFEDNKYEDAAKAFSRAVELDAKMLPALLYQGMVRVDQGSVSDAFQYYRRALALDDRSAIAHYLIAQAFSKLSPPDEQEAESHLKRAFLLDPGFQQARLELGKLYLRSNRFAEAAVELEAVIKADPKLPEAYYQLGRAYVRLKKKDEAQAIMAKFESLSNAQKEQSENQRRDIVRRLADVRF